MLSRVSKYLISFGAGALVVIGIGIYIHTLQNKIDRQAFEIDRLMAEDHPDTILVQGKVTTAPPETTYIDRGLVKVITHDDTMIVYSQDTVYITINPSGTIEGSTVHSRGGITAHVGCLAHYPDGRMEFTVGLHSKTKRQGWQAGLFFGGGIGFKNETLIGLGADLTYRKYGLWVMGNNKGVLCGVRVNF